MGMILYGWRLSAGQYAAAQTDPTVLDAVLFAKSAANPDTDRPDTDKLDIDKAWHGIHFLLTGSVYETTPRAGEAILGGEPTGDDQGYGPPRLFSPALVQQIAAGLDAIDGEELQRRFNPSAMTEIYPSVWEDGDDDLTYLIGYYADLRAFYRAAADAGDAVVLLIS